MTENQLIGTIKRLRQIKPREEWVFSVKSQIINEEPEITKSVGILDVFPRMFFQYKFAFATLSVLCVLVGTFVFVQNAVPGDALYSIKKITEKGRMMLASETDKPNVQLELANKRLEELNNIAQNNDVKKLAPAIQEFQANVSQAAKNLAQAKQPDVKQIVDVTKKIEENKQKVESMGVVVGDSEELENALAQIVEKEIKDLDSKTLTDKQKEFLSQVKKDFEAGDYSSALEKILLLNSL